ncbi:MAG: NYN domain-containing protein [Cypionkella sp.]
MRALVLIFLTSVAAVGAALLRPELMDLVLLAGPCALASLILLLRGYFWPSREPFQKGALQELAPKRVVPKKGGPKKRGEPNWIVVDGSNVMHWKDGTAQIATVREVLDRLKELGFSPGVVFDANAGYKIAGRYKHDYALGQLLDLPESRVMVVDKGTPADPVLLAAARDLGARIVTNDRYRDWRETHPEVGDAGHLIRGGYRDGALWLEIG